MRMAISKFWLISQSIVCSAMLRQKNHPQILQRTTLGCRVPTGKARAHRGELRMNLNYQFEWREGIRTGIYMHQQEMKENNSNNEMRNNISSRLNNSNEKHKIDLKARTHASHRNIRFKGSILTKSNGKISACPSKYGNSHAKAQQNLPSHNNQQRFWRKESRKE